MGGTDNMDQYYAYCMTVLRSRKYWFAIFKYLLVVGTMNAYIVYKAKVTEGAAKKLTFHKFVILLLKDIYSHNAASNPNINLRSLQSAPNTEMINDVPRENDLQVAVDPTQSIDYNSDQLRGIRRELQPYFGNRRANGPHLLRFGLMHLPEYNDDWSYRKLPDGTKPDKRKRCVMCPDTRNQCSTYCGRCFQETGFMIPICFRLDNNHQNPNDSCFASFHNSGAYRHEFTSIRRLHPPLNDQQ